MKQFFCTNCDYVWYDLDHEDCPKCNSHDIIDDEVYDTLPYLDNSYLEEITE